MKPQQTHLILLRTSAFVAIVTLLWSGAARAQMPFTTKPERTETRSGNKLFDKGNYSDAEANYKKALDKKNNMPEAVFNLGDAVYQQKRYEEAAKQFQLSAQTNASPGVRAKALHNLGNTYLSQEKWQEAVKAYKGALKINPGDRDTKYNLAYANEKLRQQQGGQGGDQKNKDEKKDQNKDQQENKNQQDQKNQENKDRENQENQANKNEQKKQGPQPKLSKEEAEKLLQALQNEEQKTNQKVQQKQVKAGVVKIEKDW